MFFEIVKMAEGKVRGDTTPLTSNINVKTNSDKSDVSVKGYGCMDKFTGRKATVSYEARHEGTVNEKELHPIENKFTQIGKNSKSSEEFYRKQSIHKLKSEDKVIKVYVQLDFNIRQEWKDEILLAITDINTAAPGLNLIEVEYNEINDESKRPLIRISPGVSGENKKECTTFGNIKTCKDHPSHPGMVFILIGLNSKHNEKRTSRHELLHALGFEHEHQRPDAETCMNYPTTETDKNNDDLALSNTGEGDKKTEEKNTGGDSYKWQYNPADNFYGITPIDIFSVMLYEEDKSIGYYRKTYNNGVWSPRLNDTTANIELSELDKLALNLVYPPCRSSTYAPEQSENGMYYCGRDVMSNHNRPDPSLAKQDRCQKGGPNCPACRTLSKPKKDGIEIESQWQGWSGFVYCGKNFESGGESKDSMCGIHYGKPCPDCYKIVLGLQNVGSQSKEAHIQEGEDREAEKGEDRER